MKTIPIAEVRNNPNSYSEIADALAQGGIVCVPTPSGYKLLADLGSARAVTSMLQAKRRVKNAPALVFVPDDASISDVVDEVSQDAQALMRAFWPGPLTLLFEAGEQLDPKVRKPLTKAKGWLGVRMPNDEISLGAVKAFGKPVIVSSANLAEKGGANSVAQVKKNFGRTVDLLIDMGDLSQGAQSTLVDVRSGAASVVRVGAIDKDRVLSALGA